METLVCLAFIWKSQTTGSSVPAITYFSIFLVLQCKVRNITVISCSRTSHRWGERQLSQKVCGPWYLAFKFLRHSDGIGHLKPVAFSGSKLILLFYYTELALMSVLPSTWRHLETVENGNIRSFFALLWLLTFCCLTESNPYLNYSGKYACPWLQW